MVKKFGRFRDLRGILETPGTRARRLPVTVADRPHLVLVPRHPPHRTNLDPRPWNPGKTNPSFLDALAALRRVLWKQRITDLSAPSAHHNKITDALLDTLAYAA